MRWTVIRRGALVAAGVLGGLLLVEGALRIVVTRQDLLAAVRRRTPRRAPDAELRLVDILELDPDPRIVFRLRPDVEGQFKGVRYRASALGIRGPQTTTAKRPGSIRVVGLGDSVMWGWGVEEDARYLDLLGDELIRSGVVGDVVNLAVPGYNTVQEVETLRVRGMEFSPDVVVLGVTGNDAEIPLFLWGAGARPWSFGRPVLLDLLAGLLHGAPGGGEAGTGGLVPMTAYLQPPDEAGTAWRVPEAFAHLVGMDNVLGALDTLAGLARTHGFAVVVVPWASGPAAHLALVTAVAQACRQRGFTVVDVAAGLAAERARDGLDEAALWLTPRDFHPNARAHRILAGMLEPPVRAALARSIDGGTDAAVHVEPGATS